MNTARIPRILKRLWVNRSHLPKSQIRPCRVCQQNTLHLALGEGDESIICITCRSNLRYGLLAEEIRKIDLKNKTIVEFDPGSPLKKLLAGSGAKYIRTYYSETDKPGGQRADGAQCEDMTRLSFADNSVDLFISSDVLEHIPNVEKAFGEIHRTLKPGGQHIFTVPQFVVETTGPLTYRLKHYTHPTQARAKITEGKVKHLLEPEFHGDPLRPSGGILTFWNFGTDAIEFSNSLSQLKTSILKGPEGEDQRLIFVSQKRT